MMNIADISVDEFRDRIKRPFDNNGKIWKRTSNVFAFDIFYDPNWDESFDNIAHNMSLKAIEYNPFKRIFKLKQ